MKRLLLFIVGLSLYGQAYKEKPEADLKIKKVSQPYLEYPISD